MPPINGAGPEADPMSLLQMAQGGRYGGRTMAQTVIGGIPFADMPDVNPGGYAANAANWLNTPATDALVSNAIERGARYQPEVAKSLFSSGPEGGFFATPGTQPESRLPWGLTQGNQEAGPNPAPDLIGMSTNNWRILPTAWRKPEYSMRAGHIIENRFANNPLGYLSYHGWDGGNAFGMGAPGHGFPVSHGSTNQRGYFFPGQLEPWINEGGPGTT